MERVWEVTVGVMGGEGGEERRGRARGTEWEGEGRGWGGRHNIQGRPSWSVTAYLVHTIFTFPLW